MKRILLITWLSVLTCITSCIDESNTITSGSVPGSGNPNQWLVPVNQVLDGGVGKDGILALTNPAMVQAFNASYLQDEDLIIGYKVGDDVRAYPHKILDWHEIINDNPGNRAIAITYCPLTGTAIGWSRLITGETTTFGVSGFLYNTNLIPYDRATDSNWSQMRMDCINGTLIGDEITSYQLVETTWQTWKEMYPNTMVVSDDLGLGRPYGVYPYIGEGGADYRVDPFLIFPIEFDDNRLPRKERVHGMIINGQAKVYPINNFTDEVTLVEDSFQNTDLLIVGQRDKNFANSFEKSLPDGTVLQYEALQNALPAVLSDSEGNHWDIFGEAISGPRSGQRLIPTNSFIGYWFSWGTFYPDAVIHTF